jgi:hypothetical protein
MKLPAYAAPLTAVGLISAAALAYEILLTRLFAIIHWHNLVATAISLALLGYGASGTFLATAGRGLHRHFAPAFVANALLFSLSSLLCVELAQQLPFDPQGLSWDWWQLAYLSATFLVLAVPFFAAANCIGLSLWYFHDQIPRIYGYDLIGAGIGAILLLGGLATMSPADNLFAIALVGILAAVSAAETLRWRRGAVIFVGLVVTSHIWIFGRPELQPAAYKDLSRALTVMGASLDHQSSGIAGTLSVVRNDRVPIRHAPGLSLHATALPPKQLAVFVDGDSAGTLRVAAAGEESSAYLQDLTSALPFTLLAAPRVAVLNAGVGLKIEQAISLGAASVSAIEPNAQLHALVCEHYLQANAKRCGPQVDWHTQAPRSFLAGDGGTFDLITLSVESDPTGLDALRTDFDLTAEAVVSYLNRLSPGGLLAIEGPTRLPPRLSLRTIDTVRAALLTLGMTAPGRHIAVIRGWQRFNLLASREPLDPVQEARIRSFAKARGFDLVWLPNMKPGDANRYQRLSEAQYYMGAAALLDTPPTRPGLDPRFRLQAASDDIPFPNRYTRWSEWWSALQLGERPALSQLDTGLFVASVTLLVVTAGGLLLIILPLLWPGRRSSDRTPKGLRLNTLLYFGLVGIAFLFIEIAWIQRLQLFLGHPVYATTAVLVAFLLFAGLGSLWAQRRSRAEVRWVLIIAVLAILLASLAYIFYMPSLLEAVADLPLAARGGVVLVLLAPLAFSMGIPFPSGLRRLGDSSDELIPWAWGINGIASVVSAASAPLLAMEIGFNGLIAVAVLAYLLLPTIRLDCSART